MPFVIVWGIPPNTPSEMLTGLSTNIIDTLVTKMEVPRHWVRPFFPTDMLGDYVKETGGCNTIYVSLDTSLFFEKPGVDELAKEVTAALAETIWKVFGCTHSIEVFVGNLNPVWKTLKKAVQETQKEHHDGS